ncbi:hypothetical protein N7468_003537 [Penicillium chermesinum]|uniref:Uncharacterized protein n=1 Tax=Penicillium chermesinum TaxID=63820 RepID=A0A9W9P990_9EURO|nr:uncharacterized protein N7468_003537 [Penicillium chermesinum]KAJ5238918.1 hypothetical protein N7468_003537 [Penicillium chermesinum]
MSASPSIKPSQLLRLPAELRLKIYEYALAVPNEYMDKPLMVVHDRGDVSTVRGRYRALSMCPSWVGEDGTTGRLLQVNHQIHDEAEEYLYSQHTLFFRNSFDLDRLTSFLDMLSPTALSRIRSVGFEVLLFVHAQEGVPKRSFRQYARARDLLARRLPRWRTVLLYFDPRFYYPPAAVGGRELAARGVLQLAKMFGEVGNLDVTFCPLPDRHHRLVEEAQQVLWRSRSPGPYEPMALAGSSGAKIGGSMGDSVRCSHGLCL